MVAQYNASKDPDQIRIQHPTQVPYDLLLKGGYIIDLANGIDGLFDVAFVGGRIAMVQAEIAVDQALQVLNVSNSIISPGWIDFHVHAYPGVSPLSIEADEYSLARGVTTAVSAGDAGAATFEGFVRYVVRQSRTRLFGFINICRTGLSGYPVGELRDLSLLDVYGTARAAQEFADVCLGIKVRMTSFIVGENGDEPLRRALRAAEIAQTRVMVHVYDIPGTLPALLALLRAGDIITHTYVGTKNGILGSDGRLLPEVQEARSRGVLFDVGHGSKAGFSLPVAQQAIDQGFLPDTISTDLHTQSVNSTMVDLANVMTKLLNLGMSLTDVIERVTWKPASFINRIAHLGTFSPGAPGDAVVFRLEDAETDISDDLGNHLPAQKQIRIMHTVSAGRLVGSCYRHPRI